jgi:hypothetical protein
MFGWQACPPRNAPPAESTSPPAPVPASTAWSCESIQRVQLPLDMDLIRTCASTGGNAFKTFLRTIGHRARRDLKADHPMAWCFRYADSVHDEHVTVYVFQIMVPKCEYGNKTNKGAKTSVTYAPRTHVRCFFQRWYAPRYLAEVSPPRTSVHHFPCHSPF